MSQDNTSFFKPFVFVLGALVLFTLFIAYMAVVFSPPSDREADPLIRQSVLKQIEPIGKSRLVAAVASAETPAAADPDAVTLAEVVPQALITSAVETTDSPASVTADTVVETATPTDTDNGTSAAVSLALRADQVPLKVRAVVATNCAGCHAQGVHGAPRSDDEVAWQQLAEKGIFTLTNTVVNGKGMMRARAESDLTDDEVAQAIGFMIGQATEVGSVDSIQAESEPMAEQPDAGTEPVTADNIVQSGVANIHESSSESAAFPDEIKAVVDTACAVCHASGVAQAPKFGDSENWQIRLLDGIDVVLARAIAGKGVMPPRGGSQLSDSELKIAIEYMISK